MMISRAVVFGLILFQKKHYPKMKISIEGDRSDQLVHRLVYFIDGHQDMDNHHVSHLCHNTLCVRRAHLNLEWSYINKNRDKCKRAVECSGHGDFPKCIVIWFILSSCTIVMPNACFSTETPVVFQLYQDTPHWPNHYFYRTPTTSPTLDDICVLLHVKLHVKFFDLPHWLTDLLQGMLCAACYQDMRL